MSSTIAALPPPTHDIPHRPEYHDGPDVPEYAFSELWQNKKEGMTFGDVLDIVNPLQHIPIVSTIYRMATEDSIGVGSRILGGALFGGPLGVLVTGLTAIVEEISGGSVEEHVASLWNTVIEEKEAASQLAATGQNDPAPAGPRHIEDDFAVAANPPVPPAVKTKPMGRGGQIPVVDNIALPQTTDPTRLSPRPLARPPVTVSPMTAVHRIRSKPVHSRQAQPTNTDRAAESQRIAKAIEHAQRAQAGLLLANLGADGADQPRHASNRPATQQVHPFKAHPYLLPRGAPPQLISRAMEQALVKYQTNLQQRSGAIIAASPQSTPAPVR